MNNSTKMKERMKINQSEEVKYFEDNQTLTEKINGIN